MSVLENTKQVLGNIVEGVSYGYSDCCIIHHSLRQVDGQMFELPSIKPLWQGSGYICCPRCSSTKSHFQIHVEIAGRRLYNRPFPQGSCHSDDVSDSLKEQSDRINFLYHHIISLCSNYIVLRDV